MRKNTHTHTSEHARVRSCVTQTDDSVTGLPLELAYTDDTDASRLLRAPLALQGVRAGTDHCSR